MDGGTTGLRSRLVEALRRLGRPPMAVPSALAGIFLVLYAYAASEPLTPHTPRVLDPSRFKAAAQASVLSELKDPDSARFRDEFISDIRPILVVCGEVNQRDDGGGYIGFKRYISGPEFVAVETTVGPAIMDVFWPAMCRRAS